jgi:hypothetical protein
MSESQKRILGLGLALLGLVNLAWNRNAISALRADDGIATSSCVCTTDPPDCTEGCACCSYNSETQSTEWKCPPALCQNCPADPGGGL